MIDGIVSVGNPGISEVQVPKALLIPEDVVLLDGVYQKEKLMVLFDIFLADVSVVVEDVVEDIVCPGCGRMYNCNSKLERHLASGNCTALPRYESIADRRCTIKEIQEGAEKLLNGPLLQFLGPEHVKHFFGVSIRSNASLTEKMRAINKEARSTMIRPGCCLKFMKTRLVHTHGTYAATFFKEKCMMIPLAMSDRSENATGSTGLEGSDVHREMATSSAVSS